MQMQCGVWGTDTSGVSSLLWTICVPQQFRDSAHNDVTPDMDGVVVRRNGNLQGSCPVLVVDGGSEFVVSGGQLHVVNITLPYPRACKFHYTFPFEAAGLDLDPVQVKVLQATGAGEEGAVGEATLGGWASISHGGCVFHSLVSVHSDLFPAKVQHLKA